MKLSAFVNNTKYWDCFAFQNIGIVLPSSYLCADHPGGRSSPEEELDI